MANTVSTNLSKSFQSLTFLAKGSVQRPTKHKKMPVQNANTFHRKKKKTALKLIWKCSRSFEDERERGGFLGEIVLVKPPSITPLGEWLYGKGGDWMAVAFCSHPCTQTCSLFGLRQQCQQDKILSYPPNRLT